MSLKNNVVSLSAGRESSRLARVANLPAPNSDREDSAEVDESQVIAEDAQTWDESVKVAELSAQGAVLEGDDKEILSAFESGAPHLFDDSGSASDEADDDEPTPFVQPMLAENEDDSSDTLDFLGIAWRKIDEDRKSEAWKWLREWVDWFTFTFHLDTSVVAPCWYKHTDVVEELWAAANAEARVWAEGEASVMPMTTWQNMLPGVIARLSASMKTCNAKKEHVSTSVWAAGKHPFVLQLDEQDWQNHLLGAVHEANSLAPGRWRAAVIDSQGQVLEASEPFSVGAVANADGSGLGQVFICSDGAGEPKAFVQAWGSEADSLQWQRMNVEGEWEPDNLQTTSTVAGMLDSELDEALEDYASSRLPEDVLARFRD